MPYSIEGHNISIGASVGIAIAPPVGSCADALIRNADLALYSAKAAGRGTFCFFAPEMHSEAQDRQILENDLRKAIGRGELQLVYQPVVNAQSEELSGFEALVRWHHPTRGVISPSLFIPLAEEAGLIPQIGEWVLRTACLEAAKWPEQIRVAVNLSPMQFVEPNLPAIVMSALANSQIQPRQLELEITEGVFLVESESTDDMFAKSEGARRPPRARRFRHRLFVAGLSEEGAVRQDQDRPELRARRRQDRAAATPPSSAPSSPLPKASAWTPPPRAPRPMTSSP